MHRVVVTSVGKRYQPYPRGVGALLRMVRRGSWSARPSTWALRDVSFSAAAGDAIGVIGMNGAGKSTLLRILAGTTIPTEGSVALNGRVAALLDLGLGMHGDFTGTQNALLTGEVMGLDGAAMRERLPWIRDFAELGAAMEQPVRTYSTGMQLRLAFSAATALPPDVLIVDEVLAVGDVYFQHKCIERIRTFRASGTTLILVTHDAAAITALCSRTVLLDQGRVLRDGPTPVVLDYYRALVAAKTQAFDIAQRTDRANVRTSTRSGTREAEILAVELSDAGGAPRRSYRVGEAARLALRVRLHRSMDTPTVGFLIRDRLGVDVFGTNTARLQLDARAWEAGSELTVRFEVALNLGPGTYSLTVAVHHGATHLDANLDWWDQALTFDVSGCEPSFVGLAALPVQATISEDPVSPLSQAPPATL